VWGQWDAGWLGWTVAHQEIGVTGLDIADGLRQVARLSGMWWAMRGVAVLTAHPDHIHRDTTGRLHAEAGPAMRWPDGWSLWVWHGRTVPEWVITDPTPERIAAESNVEIRRCAIEHMGWDRWIDATGLRPVASCDDPGNPGQTLDLHTLPNDPETRVLLVSNGSTERDGTRRRYGLPVPATCRTPLDAAAWTYAVDPDTYAQIARRT
jgi:hypothetical protein